MPSISVTLIRTTHSDFDVDDPESIRIIKLNNAGINEIDNLEVFSHIFELYLADNCIEKIENIDFLVNLSFLDLSNNKIGSDALLSSIGLLPPNIRTVNLSGNPCASDESCLIALQDYYPELNIIVGIYAGGEPLEALEDFGSLGFENGRRDKDSFTVDPSNFGLQNSRSDHLLAEYQSDGDADEEEDEEEGEEGDMPLNVDEVLKSLVERKCRLQSLEMFSVTETTEALNLEYEAAVQIEAEKSVKRRITSQISRAPNSEESFQKRLEQIKGGASKGDNVDDFRSRLKETVRNAREAIQTKHAEHSVKQT